MDWQSIFAPTILLLEGFVRGTVTLLVVLVPEAASAGLHGEAQSVSDSVVIVATILFWSVAVDAIAYRFPNLARWLKACPKP